MATVLTVQDVLDLAVRANLTESEIALLAGVTRQGFQRITKDKTVALIERHVLQFEAVSIRLAIERNDLALLLPSMRKAFRTLKRIEREGAII